jgi:dTDP-4-amino-4,6-dideoxygalactose transaminase
MIPFCKPYIPEASRKYVNESLGSDHQQGDGPFTREASNMISNLVGGGHVLLTPSCTHALEMASMLGNFGPGDEVILPSYTFTSAATAITKFGATPVFVDIDPKTKVIDTNQVADAVTENTVAISWVNYAGVAPDIEALQAISKNRNLLLVEDNAHGLGGSYKGKPLGSFGHFATQSFHATKNIQCGEGGALIINDVAFIERSEIIREKGTDRSKFIKGEVQKYRWVDKGSSYLLAETLAAVLLGQLESFEAIQKARQKQIENYTELAQLSPDDQMEIGEKLTNASHMFYFCMAEPRRKKIIELFKKNGIPASSHYETLHQSPYGKKFQNQKIDLSNATQMSEKIVRLPVYSTIDQLSEFALKQIKLVFDLAVQ